MLAADSPHVLRGIGLIVAAVSIFACMDTMAKYLSQSYAVLFVVWARYAVQMMWMLVVLGPRLRLRLVQTRRPGLQIARGTVLTLSSVVFFAALARMPLAEASAITFITPLLVAAFSGPVLRERVPRAAWYAIAVGLLGVLIVIRPGSAVFSAWALLPIASAVCFATYQLMTRKLAGVDSPFTTLFIPTVVATLGLAPAISFASAASISRPHALLFLAMGLLGAVGHFFLIKAFSYARASTIAPFIYAQLVGVLILGYLVFDQFPDGWSLAGMGIIVVSGLFVATRHRRA